MKTRIILALLAITLAACAPAVTSTPTETPVPTATSTAIPPTFIPTAEMTPDIGAPTPLPTLPPPPIFTPDAIQVERWQEYQTELAKVMTCDAGHDCPNFEYALCEWDILGRSGRKVYVWAVCPGNRKPAVIYLEADGSIQKVETPENSTATGPAQMISMFPADVREKFGLYTGYSMFYGRVKEMIDHLNYRETHPEEPPLIVLGKIPTATPVPPTPTPPTVAILTPDAFQVAKWQEYQTKLAKAITCDSRHDCPDFERFACEWDILGRSGQDVYAWAFCAETVENRNIHIDTNPAVIHLEADRSIRNIEVPLGTLWDGTSWNIEIRRLFPSDVQEKIFLYHLSKRFEEMVNHSVDRLTHPEIPPLIVLSATPTATPTP